MCPNRSNGPNMQRSVNSPIVGAIKAVRRSHPKGFILVVRNGHSRLEHIALCIGIGSVLCGYATLRFALTFRPILTLPIYSVRPRKERAI